MPRRNEIDERAFWDLIETGGKFRRDDLDKQLEAITRKLSALSESELVSFNSWFNQKLADSYTWKLWGAAYLINGGCSDDGFEYFRCWIISRGRKVFNAALANPDSLAKVVDDDDEYEFEALGAAAYYVYQERFKAEIPAPAVTYPKEPFGEDWDFEDVEETARRLPKLAKKYNSGEKPETDPTLDRSLERIAPAIRKRLGTLSLEQQIDLLETELQDNSDPRSAQPLQCVLAQLRLRNGIAMDRAGQVEVAITNLQRAIELGPDTLEVYISLGHALKYAGRASEAAECFREMERRAAVAGDADRRELARRNLASLLPTENFDPVDTRSARTLASAMERSGKLFEAIKYYKLAIKLGDNSTQTWVQLGDTYGKAGMVSEAATAYEACVVAAGRNRDEFWARIAVERLQKMRGNEP